MSIYSKPTIKEREVKLSSFFMRNSSMNPFSDFYGFTNIGTVFATCAPAPAPPCPPSTGTAGLKDEKYLATLRLMKQSKI